MPPAIVRRPMKWLKLWRLRLLLFFAVVGPGFITANVDNDPNGIYTYSSAGASFGYSLLWTLIPVTIALIVIQEMCARMGAVTGKGLSDLIREEYGLRPTFLMMLALIVMNYANIVGEFAGIASSMELFHVSKYLSVPVAAAFVWVMVVKGSYSRVEKIFLVASLFYVAYIVAGALAHPAWKEALISTVTPPKLSLLGHGTYDGKDSKFNLRGPDITAADLAKLLELFQRPSAVIAAFSASAPFLPKLSAKDRVVITSTRSGHEQNYSRFGEYISGAIADPEADLDKDGQTSLLEAYLIASRRTGEFYETEGRLATEHSLIDDNGDGLGTPADWFRGVRPVKKAKEGAQLDGLRAHQFYLVRNEAERRLSPEVRARRDELELAIGHLRESKATMPEDDYYQKLETLAVEMARLYEKSAGSPGNEK